MIIYLSYFNRGLRSKLSLSFEKLKLIPSILKALKSEGYTEPTPIQAEVIPLILERKDIIGCAQTGTGKARSGKNGIRNNIKLLSPSQNN